METCVGAHHLSRKLASLGHDARLMPAKYVRPYSKGPKNDFNDAEAIAEAVQRPTMKFVATKTAEQLDLQALHRVRERLVSQRTGIINQIRPSCWNAGSPCARGSASCVRNCLPSCDTHRCPVATHVTCHRGVGRRLAPAGSAHRWPIRRDRGTGPSRSGMFAPNDGAWHRANHFERHGGRDRHWRLYSPKAATSAPGPDWCPNRSRRRPHDPRQNLEARQSLYLRVLFVQAAWVVLVKVKNWERYGLKSWIEAAKRRCTTTCWRSRSPTSLPASPGRCWLKDAPSSWRGPTMQASDPLILAPCSALSRRSLATPEPAASQARRLALTAPARDAIDVLRAGTKERPLARTKKLRDMRSKR